MNWRQVTHSKHTGRNQVHKPPVQHGRLKGKDVVPKQNHRKEGLVEQDQIVFYMYVQYVLNCSQP